MIRYTTTAVSAIKASERFEPRFHYVFNEWENLKSSKKWNVKLLGDPDIMLKMTDGEHAGQIFVESGVRFIKNSYVKDFLIGTLDGTYITPEKHKSQSRSALKPLDILFTTIGHLGSCAIVPEDFGEANINQNLVKIEVDENTVNPYYLTAYLNSNCTRSQISALFTGNLHSIITYPKIRSIRVLLPSRDKQDLLGEKYRVALESESEGVALINRTIARFKELLGLDFNGKYQEKSFSTSLSNFSKFDMWTPKYSRPLYVQALSSIRENNEVVCLDDSIVDTAKGDEVGSEQYIKYLSRKKTDVPFIRTSDMFNYGLDRCPDYFVDRSVYEELGQNLIQGDVLISNDGKIGLTSLVQNWSDFVMQSHIKRLRLRSRAKEKFNLTPEYLFLCLTCPEIGGFQANKFEVVQSTIPTISSNLQYFEIPVLSKSLIANLTNEIQKAFQKKEKAQSLIQEIKSELDSLLDL